MVSVQENCESKWTNTQISREITWYLNSILFKMIRECYCLVLLFSQSCRRFRLVTMKQWWYTLNIKSLFFFLQWMYNLLLEWTECKGQILLNKGRPTWWHLLYYVNLLLNMFRMLIHPSSGACDWLEACRCYVAGLAVGDVVSECRLQPALGYHITNSQPVLG